MGVKYGQTVSIKGMGPEKDFSVSITSRKEVLPAYAATVMLPDASVTRRLLEQEMTVLDLDITGNTKGLKITSTQPNKLDIQDGVVRKVGSFYSNDQYPTLLQVENEYGKRLYVPVIPEELQKAERRDAGVFNPGTMGAAVTELTRRLFGAYQPGAYHQDVYLDGGTYDATNAPPSVMRNPNRMLPDLDLSGVSVSRGRDVPAYETGAGNFPVMLVSPRHAVCNTHSGVWTTLKVWFMRRDGSLQMVTVLGEIDIPYCDARVVLFDQDVTGCAIYATLPPEWDEYMPSVSNETYKKHNICSAVPLVVRQHNPGDPGAPWNFNINTINTNSSHLRIDWGTEIGAYGSYQRCAMVSLIDDPLASFHMRAYGGDSGSPCFLLVPDRKDEGYAPALVSSYWTSGSGPAWPLLSQQVTQAMHTLSANYGDTRKFDFGLIDISHFPRFPKA